jgi:hypothetical protein
LYSALFDGSHTTVHDASLGLLAYMHRFSLSKYAQNQLLNLVKSILPINNILPKNITKLELEIGIESKNILKKWFCEKCNKQMSDVKKCINDECEKHGQKVKQCDSFSYVDFSVQLQSMVRKYFAEISQYLRAKRDFFDIIDASYYHQVKQTNKLHLLCYTDGVQLVKSASNSCWPVVVSLVELPGNIRDSHPNKIFCGLWFGKHKPTSDILFSTLTAQLDALNSTGLIITHNNIPIKYSFGLYGLMADTPGKALAMKIISFNGKFGCPYCVNPGSYMLFSFSSYALLIFSRTDFHKFKSGRHDKKIHKYIFENEKYEDKTLEVYEQGFIEGTHDVPYLGIRGKPLIADFIPFPEGVPCDYMHLVCLGIFKGLMKKWFIPKKLPQNEKAKDSRARTGMSQRKANKQPEYYIGI